MNRSLVIITKNGEDDFTSDAIQMLSHKFHPEIYSCDRVLESHEFISMAYSGQVIAIEGDLAPDLNDDLFSSLPFLEKIFITEPVPFLSIKKDIHYEIIDKFSAIPLAEEALALLLQLARENDLKDPREIHGLTAGIIGLTPSSFMLAKLLGAFGVNVLYFDPHHEKSSIGVSMERYDLISRSDIIVLCRNPFLTETIIDRELCNVIRSDSYLILLSDFSAIDFPAVIDTMYKGIISGFGCLKDYYKKINNDAFSNNIVLSSHSPLQSYKAHNDMITELVGEITKE